MAAAFGVGVGKLIDQHDLRMTRNDRVQIHFGEQLPFVLHLSARSEEHTSELQSRLHLVCRLLLEKKKKTLTGGKQDHPAPGDNLRPLATPECARPYADPTDPYRSSRRLPRRLASSPLAIVGRLSRPELSSLALMCYERRASPFPCRCGVAVRSLLCSPRCGHSLPLGFCFRDICALHRLGFFFFFNDPPTPEISPLPLPDALPI